MILIEDDWFWQEAVIETLQANGGFEVVTIASSLTQARLTAGQIEADVILLDVSLGSHAQGGIDLAYEWKQAGMAIPPIVMLTSHDDAGCIAECFAAGVTNYLCKRDIDRLPRTLMKLVHGQQGMLSYVAEALRLDYLRLRERTDRDQLTRQERSILEAIHMGHTQAQIAVMLHNSERTIKNHINRILRKMNCTSSKEAAERAALRGWLETVNDKS